MQRLRWIISLAVVVGAVLCMTGGLPSDGLLCLAPVLVLAAMLFAQRYPGERLLMTYAARRRNRRPRSIGAPHWPHVSAVRLPRGGLLMGFALAVRPPPHLCAVS